MEQPKFVVTDEDGKAHLVEAPDAATALTQTYKGLAVRIAHQVDIEAYENAPPPVRRVSARR